MPFETGNKRLEFEPVNIKLIKYDTEIMFVNYDIAEDFLDILEAMENARARDPHEERELKEGEDYEFMSLSIQHDAEDAFVAFFEARNSKDTQGSAF